MRSLNVLAVLAIGTLAGCNPAPPINFSVSNVPLSPAKADADLRSITVTLASPDQKTGRIPADALIAVAPWKEALTDAVNRAVVFNDDSTRHANLAVKILKLDFPLAGLDMQTDVEAHYELTDRKSGGAIFDQVIATSGICPLGYAFVGAIRARESLNRAVQANISEFIVRLERSTANMSAPARSANTNPAENPQSRQGE